MPSLCWPREGESGARAVRGTHTHTERSALALYVRSPYTTCPGPHVPSCRSAIACAPPGPCLPACRSVTHAGCMRARPPAVLRVGLYRCTGMACACVGPPGIIPLLVALWEQALAPFCGCIMSCAGQPWLPAPGELPTGLWWRQASSIFLQVTSPSLHEPMQLTVTQASIRRMFM